MKTSKAYVMRSLLPAKCRELVKAPDVSQAFAMLVLSLIDLSPSKKLSAGAHVSASPHLVSFADVSVTVETARAGFKCRFSFCSARRLATELQESGPMR